MIALKHVSASYDGHMLFWDLNIRFPDSGVFLLKGESGSGKTTILNLLCGLKPPDGGTIAFEGDGGRTLAQTTAYLTQEAFFVEYLTVSDNLALACKGESKGKAKECLECLELFGMGELYGSPVATLSSGERQRLSLARAVLAGKKVIVLDEPTAFLDRENKNLVLGAIRLLGADALVIFASHDQDSAHIADGVIDMANIDRNRLDFCLATPEDPGTGQEEGGLAQNASEIEQPPKALPRAYVAKWFASSSKEKRTSVYLALVFGLVFFALCLGDTPWHKLEYHAEKVYGINSLRVTVTKSSGIRVGDLMRGKVNSVVLDYDISVTDGLDGAPDGSASTVDYAVNAPALPARGEDFRLSDRLLAGTWFTSPNQVILTLKNAQRTFGSAEAAVGQALQIKFYGYEDPIDMTVAGVFDTLGPEEQRYFSAASHWESLSENEMFFISDAFGNAYDSDPAFYRWGYRGYNLYFDSFSDLKSYRRDFEGIVWQTRIEVGTDLESLFYGFFLVAFPLGALSGILALLLYSRFQSGELAFNMKSFAVFSYMEYPVSSIRRAWLGASMLHLARLLAVSLLSSIALMASANLLNSRYRFMEFMPFTFNPVLIGGMILAAMAVCALSQRRAFRRLEKYGWYGILIETRDLT